MHPSDFVMQHDAASGKLISTTLALKRFALDLVVQIACKMLWSAHSHFLKASSTHEKGRPESRPLSRLSE
jgi:hypothetical protein